jgi:hypothetical protein
VVRGNDCEWGRPQFVLEHFCISEAFGGLYDAFSSAAMQKDKQTEAIGDPQLGEILGLIFSWSALSVDLYA